MKEDGRIFYMTGFEESIDYARKLIALNSLSIKSSHTTLYYNERLTVFEITR